MTVAHDERVGTRGIDAERLVVHEQRGVGQREVEQDLPARGAALRRQMVGEAVLREQGHSSRAEGRPLHGDGVELAVLREDVVDVVDDVGQDETVDLGDGAEPAAARPAARGVGPKANNPPATTPSVRSSRRFMGRLLVLRMCSVEGLGETKSRRVGVGLSTNRLGATASCAWAAGRV
jgi:hypothetical protein